MWRPFDQKDQAPPQERRVVAFRPRTRQPTSRIIGVRDRFVRFMSTCLSGLSPCELVPLLLVSSPRHYPEKNPTGITNGRAHQRPSHEFFANIGEALL